MKVLTILICLFGFVWAGYVGMEKEAHRQCIVADDMCEKYGACDNLCDGEY